LIARPNVAAAKRRSRVAREPKERAVKHFLIKYRFQDGSPDEWRKHIERFIAAVEADQTLNGRIAYRCMKADNGSGEYYHLAAVADEEAGKALQQRDFFKRYSEETKRVSGGTVEVLPLAIIAETSARP
jgi:quinol monooxygenase YgiN